MGLTYGVEVATNALIKLCADSDIERRVDNAISELDVITDKDVLPEHFKGIQALSNEIRTGIASKEKAITHIVYLCRDIIANCPEEFI